MRLLDISFLIILFESIEVISGNALTSQFISKIFDVSDSNYLIKPNRPRSNVYEMSIPSHNEACGVSPNAIQSNKRRFTRVVGGYQAPRGFHTYIAAIRYWDGDTRRWSRFCGGTLIHPKFILTAAHCFQDFYDPKDFDVILGDWDKSVQDGTEQRARIKKLYMHPRYKGESNAWADDIAIVELMTEVTLNKYVSLACLPNKNFDYYAGRMCMVKGWGNTDSESENYPNRLQVGMVPLIDRYTCTHSSYEYSLLPRSSFCAGYLEGGIDSCQGDSGGPLTCQENDGLFYVIGVTSWGIGCTEKGVYVKVSHYIEWIEKILKYRKKYVYANH